MNAELKRKWVDGLRSWKYEQTIGTLFDGTYKDHDGHTIVRCCALGVLNDVSGMGYWADDGYVVEAEDEFDQDAWNEHVYFHCDEDEYKPFVEEKHWVDDEPTFKLPDVKNYRTLYSEQLVERIKSCFHFAEDDVHSKVAEAAGIDHLPRVRITEAFADEHSLQKPPPGVKFNDKWPIHSLNDAGVPFEAIAELIEEQL